MVDPKLQETLASWAKAKPTIEVMYVFGSRAQDTAQPSSDLDLAFDFIGSVDDDLSELIVHAEQWRRELSNLTGLEVKDIYLGNDNEVGPERTVVYRRQG